MKRVWRNVKDCDKLPKSGERHQTNFPSEASDQRRAKSEEVTEDKQANDQHKCHAIVAPNTITSNSLIRSNT